MILRAPASREELEIVCKIYMSQNDSTFLRIEPETCLESIVYHWHRMAYLRVIEKGGKLVGFIMGDIVQSKHCKLKHMVQEYFCTNLQGYSAARAVIMAHKDMADYASRRKAAYVISAGSHMDPDCVFAKLLERSGWQRRSYVAVKHLIPLVTA